MLDRSVDRIVSRIYERYFATHSSMITEDVGSAPANTAPTNPFAGLHFSDITEIQKFLEGKKLPVISPGKRLFIPFHTRYLQHIKF